MFEKISQIAEHAATNVSRRQFLGRLGQAAVAAAGVLGGLLLLPIKASARHTALVQCTYVCPDGSVQAIGKNQCRSCRERYRFGGRWCDLVGCEGAW